MKCTLARKRYQSDSAIIEVLDPAGRPFGRISHELAVVLAPAMEAFPKLRTQARLLNRKRKDSEWEHQPCSEQMKIMINIYGRKQDAEKIGRLFGQHNVWFQPTLLRDPNVPLENPHARKVANLVNSGSNNSRHILSETRTLEEATQAVSRLFDHSASTGPSLEETNTPDLIQTDLLPHQKQGLTFMLQRELPRTYGRDEAENSSLWRRKYLKTSKIAFEEVVSGIVVDEEPEEVYGGLLADVMGLGKTIEALALIVSTKNQALDFSNQQLGRPDPNNPDWISNAKSTLLITPLSTIKNWEDQIAEHVRPGDLTYCVYHGSNRIDDPLELAEFDVVLTTYGTVAADMSNKSSRDRLSPIRQLKWFRIVLDEAHTIREQRALQSQAIYSLSASRRWCLTGTPIQNRMEDLGSLTRFLRLYPYDTAARFNQYIRQPAQSGDASFLKALRVFVDSFTLRRLRDSIDLPARHEFVEVLQHSDDEKRLHDFFKEISQVQIEKLTKEKTKSSGLQHHVLQSIMTLRLICAHGRDLLKEKDLARLQGSTADEAIDIDQAPKLPTINLQDAFHALSLRAEADLDLCQNCDKRLGGESPRVEVEDAAGDARCFVLPCFDIVCRDCFASIKESFDSRPDHSPISCPYCHLTMAAQYVAITPRTAQELESPEENPDQVSDKVQKPQYFYNGPHTKTRALLRDIEDMDRESKKLENQGEPPIKCVVFSEFTSHLDLIGRALKDHDKSFLRIDGSMSLSKRKAVLDALNNDPTAKILLASIKAAGQGLNLTAASRAFIMEPMWNPAAETQAVDRIYRIGQKREVTIKRFQMADSIEGKIVELQQRKQALADVSMNRNHANLSKKEQREKHFNDIRALFK